MEDGAQVRQLPRGRHGLTREEVEASQRGRMLAAMADAVAEKGFARTTVKDVLTRAGVSRETFYEHFENKDACFFTAYEMGAEQLQGAVRTAWEGGTADPLDRLDRAMAAYLEVMSREPAIARVFLIEVYGAGPDAVQRRFVVFQGFVDLVAGLVGARTREERVLCEAFVGAVSSMVTVRVGTGRGADLPDLREDIAAIARRLWPGMQEGRATA